MEKIKAGIIGAGMIGVSHIESMRRLGYVDIVALAENNQQLADKKAKQLQVPQAYGSYQEMLSDPDIDVVHNCTPNNKHLEINLEIIKSGKHVFSEKPLAMNAKEAEEMLSLLDKHKVVNGVNFLYRMYPLVREMKTKVEQGDVGEVRLIHGSYLQDWLLYETDYNWRIEPEICGKTRAVGDIGSHWCDLVQTVTGLKITEVFADFATVIPTRKKYEEVETFSVGDKSGNYEEIDVKTEDWASVLLRFENGARGVFYVSEVSAGRGCYFNVEIDGSKRSYYWNQETGDRMWVGNRDEPNLEIIRNPNQMAAENQQYSVLPGGHPEGWYDALKNNIQAFYSFIKEGKDPVEDKPDFATFADGYDLMLITDAIVESNEKGKWIEVKR